jgi:DNA-binding transcriptional LysR family regulator
MSDAGTPTLDQLNVFLTVVDTGSFAGAARKLGRAASVISYTVANLEAQLGVPLFDRETTRKPVLTADGRALLSEARIVANGINGLRAKAKGLRQGLEPEVHLALDVMLPAARAVDALRAFQDEFPTVTLRLSIEVLGAVTQMVQEGVASLGVSGPLLRPVDGVATIDIGFVPCVPVAGPDHPLARAGRNAPGAGRNHVQLVLTDRSRLTEGQEFAVYSNRTWRLADLGSKHILLREGIGWGLMPLPMVREDLASGRLVTLDMPDVRGGNYAFHIVYRADTPPGPASAFLIDRFARQAEA